MSKNDFVAVLMGSESDLSIMEHCLETLEACHINYEVNILSAHRTPELTTQYISDAQKRGAQVFIAAAGMAAHLAGCVSAHTIKPVIGVPLSSGDLKGMDALLATVQMPGGIPVATVAIGKAGAKNAAILSAQILAIKNPEIAEQLLLMRHEKKQALQQANLALQKKYADKKQAIES